MRSVALRAVTDQGMLRSVLAAFELDRTDDHVALWVPVGSPGYTRKGEKGGPRGRFLLPDRWEPGFVARRWLHLDVVMVHRFDQEWSTWRWLTAEPDWTPGAYVNLERKWVVHADRYDTDDLTFDVVVAADGTAALKDEDELAWALDAGVYSTLQAERIRAIGRRALRHVKQQGWPIGTDWDRWRPPSEAGLPQLPAGWDHR